MISHRTSMRWLGALMGMMSSACGGNGTPDPECAAAEPLRVATYNAGLARGDVPYVDERVGPVTDALAALDVDLLCLQELWEDWDALAAGLPHLPNVVHHAPSSDCAAAACTPFEMEPMLVCGAEECDGLVGPDLLQCGLDRCGDEVGALSPSCTTCVINAADGGLQGMEADCLGTGDQDGDQYLYDCQFDSGILTSAELLDSESRRLDSTTVAAAVDHARVRAGGSDIDVFCTHLASDLPFAYGGEHGSWRGEQARQMDQLLAFVEEKNDGSRPAIVLGDLNHGPPISASGIEAQWADHYDRWGQAGFDNPYASQEDAACTACGENSFRSSGAPNQLIDHVLLEGSVEAVSCERILTEAITIDIEGAAVQTHLSDHYGLTCEVAASCAP